LQPLDELELSELKPTVKVENKQEDNISKWKRLMVLKSIAW
jgi:hypothetical protein